MARVVFQRQSPDTRITFPSFPRGKRKSLQLSDENVSLTQAEYFEKPPKRAELPSCCSPVGKTIKSHVKSCTDDEVHDLTWFMLRSLCRETAPLPKSTSFSKQQTIPLSTGYNAHLSTKSEHLTAVAYAPIIDSKPAGMATVFTTMKNCRKMCLNLGQEVSLQTMDQQLYAIAILQLCNFEFFLVI